MLTPDWVKSAFTNYESSVAAHIEMLSRAKRLIPVMLRQCDAPAEIDSRTRAEFMDPSKFESEMVRLIRVLRPETNRAAEPVQAVDAGLRAIANILRVPAVKHAFAVFEHRFANLSEQIDRLADFKSVHDQFHDIQIKCYEPMMLEIHDLATNELAADNLRIYTDDLQAATEQIREITSRLSFRSMPLAWVTKLENAYRKLDAAVTARDVTAATRAASDIDSILAQQPAAMDARLSESARALHLDDVIRAIDEIRAKAELSDERFDHQALEAAHRGLEQLKEMLDALVRDHGLWQNADDELRRVHKTINGDPPDLAEDDWPYVKSLMSDLTAGGAEWAEQLENAAVSFEKAVAKNDTDAMRRHFRMYRQKAIRRFDRVDKLLKQHCDELRKIGDPLAVIVKVLS